MCSVLFRLQKHATRSGRPHRCAIGPEQARGRERWRLYREGGSSSNVIIWCSSSSIPLFLDDNYASCELTYILRCKNMVRIVTAEAQIWLNTLYYCEWFEVKRISWGTVFISLLRCNFQLSLHGTGVPFSHDRHLNVYNFSWLITQKKTKTLKPKSRQIKRNTYVIDIDRIFPCSRSMHILCCTHNMQATILIGQF